jgi:hypothetical protein
MVRTFLDLSAASYSRPHLRRMEKELAKTPSYLGKIERVFFFQFKTPKECFEFQKAMILGAQKSGDKTEIAYMDDPFSTKQNPKSHVSNLTSHV